ncbi:unnamed protein product [Arctia plantaginis]|uniref:Uncharacterized protein n=1 Tax=Arctia plantaginis TaxID=874455 RepID=A0A8S1BAQ0_ARCPL|nr:unnamed protein product [Arctia plantaginis]
MPVTFWAYSHFTHSPPTHYRRNERGHITTLAKSSSCTSCRAGSARESRSENLRARHDTARLRRAAVIAAAVGGRGHGRNLRFRAISPCDATDTRREKRSATQLATR